MEFVNRIKRLWRHRPFRRLLALRICTQFADGLVQVGLYSFALFNPSQQPDAWSIVSVLAITLLPFSVVGPFISGLLDRWSRQRIALVTESARIVGCLGAAALIAFTDTAGLSRVVLYLVLLVMLSLNRFLLAGLAAALPETVDHDEVLDAASLMPMIGPAGLTVATGVGVGIRVGLANWLDAAGLHALIYLVAAAWFVVSLLLALRIGVNDLGPREPTATSGIAQIWRGLKQTLRYLGTKPQVLYSLGAVAVARIAFGTLLVTTTLGYRYVFNSGDDLPALAGTAVWAVAAGVGYFCSGFIAPPIAKRFGIRKTIIAFLVASAIVQVGPGSYYVPLAQASAAFGLGLLAQGIKICADTVTKAHVADEFRGRTFLWYDAMNNVTYCLGGTIVACFVPDYGFWWPAYLGIAVFFAIGAIWFARGSHRLGAAIFDKGTTLENASELAG